MRSDSQMPISGRVNNGIIPSSFKTISSYLKIVSSGASTVASTVRSAASAVAEERDSNGDTSHYQVSWAGFDRLELENGIARHVLLLGFSYGYQVWDVEPADNVHNLVSKQDGPVSFMQILPKPSTSIQSEDKFSESRPLLAICADGSFSGDVIVHEGSCVPRNGSVNASYVPTLVWFYSLRSQSYVHHLRFRSIVHLVRCSSRVVAVLQSSQIHCLNAGTLEREYTILINPITTASNGLSNIGVGPLAVGPRWMAYSGSQVAISNSRCLSPQYLSPSPSFGGHGSDGGLVAHYARESSKHLAAGIVTLGGMGYKKLTRYYSEMLPEVAGNCQTGTVRVKAHSVADGHSPDADNVGMVIVRDIADKTVIAQFKAHKSPIQSLCFDPSGTLLVTASIQGHNINVFRIMPGLSEGSSRSSYVHLYRLQRGFTNAVIQNVSFSNDSRWIMISSSRGTSHLFAISPSGGSVRFSQSNAARFSSENNVSSSGLQVLTQQTICSSGPPVTVSAVSRIRSGCSNNGWKNTVSGAAAAAAGRLSSLSGAIASAFREGESNDPRVDSSSLKKKYYLLVFSPTGCVMQYALRFDDMKTGVGSDRDSDLDYDSRLTVEPMRKWNICQKVNNVNFDTSKVYPDIVKWTNDVFSDVSGTTSKEKIVTEEKRRHMYISEAELRMHRNPNPLWARPEVYFQLMRTDGSDKNREGACGGEVEIERIPTHTLEGRSKKLVPVFEYLRSSNFRQGGVSIVTSDNDGQFPAQGSDASDGDSLDSIINGGNLENELDDEKGPGGLCSMDVVDTNTVNTEAINMIELYEGKICK